MDLNKRSMHLSTNLSGRVLKPLFIAVFICGSQLFALAQAQVCVGDVTSISIPKNVGCAYGEGGDPTWDGAYGGTITGDDVAGFTVIWTKAGTFRLKRIFPSQCYSPEIYSQYYIVSDGPEIVDPYDIEVVEACGEATLIYNGPVDDVYWQGSATGTSTDYPNERIVTENGTYYARALGGSGCWSVDASVQVTIPEAPTGGEPPEITRECINGGQKIRLSTGDSSDRWFNSSDSNTPLSNTNVVEVETTDYIFYVESLFPSGCKYRTRYELEVKNKGNGNSSLCENYIKSYIPREALKSGVANLNNQESVKESITYFDGLGRTVQKVIRNHSNQLVASTRYDSYGRIDKAFLVYPDQSNDGAYEPDAATHARQYYTGRYGVDDGNAAFLETVYEPSPLNRVDKKLSPGESWAASDRGVSFAYEINSASDQVIAWAVKENSFEAISLGYYSTGSLYKNITNDEQGNETREYVDKLGQTILKEVESDDEAYPFLRTYYIYDDLDLLRFVVPPNESRIVQPDSDEGQDVSGGFWVYIDEDTEISAETIEDKSFPLTIWVKDGVKVDLVDNFSVNALNDGDLFIKYGLPPNSPQAVKEMTYQYQYDDLKRMTAKKVPDADWVYMVYDQWDRLVLTQDGNQRENDAWLFTSYDALNRPVMSGMVTDAQKRSQKDLQDDISELTSRYIKFSTTDDHGYTTDAFPYNAEGLTVNKILSVTYYDTYDYLELSGWGGFEFEEDLSVMSDDILPQAKGLVSGARQLILGTETYLNSSVYYDYKYRAIQSKAHDPQMNIIRTTNQYDFIGNLTATKTAYSGLFEKNIYKWFDYDHMDRLLSVDMQIGEDAQNRVTLLENQYNEIGELVEKNLHRSPPGVLQSLDFDYNIRGWLTTINQPDLSKDGTEEYESTDVFGMELMYDNAPGEAAQYNGNIGQVNWKQAYAGATSHYRYGYDALNRLEAANYGENDIFSVPKFDVSGIQYDANGNILKLNRKADSNADMDLLEYTYYDGNNRLKIVDDDGNDGGFKDGATLDQEYDYDVNGNMRTDANKGISRIVYNRLNLPEVVELGDVHIEYDYLADGTKLAKRVTKGEETAERLYQNGMVFENGVLDHILTEVGKVVPFIPGNQELLDYQYFIKDHLGNVRSVVREQRIYEYLATMETENAEAEESQFSNIPETRQKDVVHSYNGDEFVVTNNGQPLGPAFALNVNKGDVVDLSVYGKAVAGGGEEAVAGTEAIIAALVEAFTSQSITIGESASALSNGLAEGLGLLGSGGSSNEEATGYLNYLLFDKNFTLVTGGFTTITASSYEQKAIHDIVIDRPGYLIAYLSYESNAPDQVYFDDFSVTLETSTVIQQDDYYPFGLTFNSYSSGTENLYKYNGKEEQKELGLLDYGARYYDPSLGFFTTIDPRSEDYYSWSPYNYVGGNPIKRVDVNGEGWDDIVKAAKDIKKGTEALGGILLSSLGDNSVKASIKFTIGPQAGFDVEGFASIGLNVAAFELISGEVEATSEGVKTDGNNIITGDVKITQGAEIGLGAQVKGEREIDAGSKKATDSVEEVTPIVPGVVNVKEKTTYNDDGTTSKATSTSTGYSFSFILGIDINISVQENKRTTEDDQNNGG